LCSKLPPLWWKTLEERAVQPANPVNPQRVTWELSLRLPDNVILTSDSGSCANWYARDLRIRQVTWEQRVMEGDPKFDASQNLPNVPYHRFAELIGLKGIYVDRPEAMGPAWDEALAANRPVVLEVKTDPEVPPLPPHITFQQAKHFRPGALQRRSAPEQRYQGHRPAGPERDPSRPKARRRLSRSTQSGCVATSQLRRGQRAQLISEACR
jgi:thiamine pyrophosphate-dependent acetolactate synthase large subunit-like protein